MEEDGRQVKSNGAYTGGISGRCDNLTRRPRATMGHSPEEEDRIGADSDSASRKTDAAVDLLPPGWKKTRSGRRWACGLLAAPDGAVLVPATPEHGTRWMGQFPCDCGSSNCAREAVAVVLVAVARVVPVPIRRPAVGRVVVPTAAPVHPVRASTPSSLAPSQFDDAAQ
jgi:hypothetical protein